MSEETKTYHVAVKMRFGIEAKSVEHARMIAENSVSYSVRLGIPIETEVTVLGEIKPRPLFDLEGLE
jgi:hypothetical protein